MSKLVKNYKLNLFTFIEIVFAFTGITLALSLNCGYLNQMSKETGTIEMLYILNGFACLAVFVTALGITGIQLIHMHRRTSEIGLRKAIGASSRDILLLMLYDTFKLIIIPAVFGVVAGIVLSFIIPFEEFGQKAYVDAGLIAAIAGALLFFTLLSGFIPAFNAARMEPVAALGRRPGLLSSKSAISHGRIGSKLFTGLLFLIAAAIISYGIYINYSLEVEERENIKNTAGAPPATTQTAPAFSFKDASGQVISSASLKGKNYCLLIWTVGCPPSKDALIALENMVKEGYLKNSDIYAVSIDKSTDVVKKYIAENKLSIAAYIDNDKATKWAYKVNSIPVLYIVGSDGIIKSRARGWSEAMKSYIIQEVKGAAAS